MSYDKKIKVIQKDYLENTESVIYEGLAEVKTDDFHEITYQENATTSVRIKLADTGGFLERISEARTLLEFNLKENTEGTLESEYGKMQMQVSTDKITLKHNNLMLGYTLKQDNSEVGKFLMKVEWNHE